jgi:hypothetical protein
MLLIFQIPRLSVSRNSVKTVETGSLVRCERGKFRHGRNSAVDPKKKVAVVVRENDFKPLLNSPQG